MKRINALTIKQQLAILSHNIAEVVPAHGLREVLERADREGRPCRVKLGLDPTAPDIHLGHTVVLRKLRQFQDCGHTVILIVGDYTARIGDPSGRSHTRPVLSEKEIRTNASTYKKQALKILHSKNLKIHYNSEWLGKMRAADIIALTKQATVAQLLTRDDFHERFTHGRSIGLHELLYPLLQAQDSVAIQADIEIGGTDQTFNMLMGRMVQERLSKTEQVVLTMPLIPGTDGKKKMSKSLGNGIGICESADEIYGKIMSLPDSLILQYLRLVSDVPQGEIPKSERDIQGSELPLKEKLALSVASLYATKKEAIGAQERFRKTFRRRQFPENAPRYALPAPAIVLDIITKHLKIFSSNSEARRKILEGAVEVDGKKVNDPRYRIEPTDDGVRIRIGKKKFYRITRQ